MTQAAKPSLPNNFKNAISNEVAFRHKTGKGDFQMDYEIKKASDTNINPRPQMSRIFVECYYKDLKMLCQDKERLEDAFEHIFSLNDFYVAVVEGKIKAFIAISDRSNSQNVINLDKKTLQRYLGLIRGSIAYTMLTKALVNKTYEFPIAPNTGEVEFVSTSVSARGQGLAGRLIEYGIYDSGFDEFILEVANTNDAAIRVYERLGFKQFEKIKSPHPPKHSGFEYFYYMKRKK